MNTAGSRHDREPPPRPDGPTPGRGGLGWLAWVVGVVNAVLAGLLLAAWDGRPVGCVGGCPVPLPARWLVIALLLVDVGLILALASLAYGRLVRMGARMGERLKERRGSR